MTPVGKEPVRSRAPTSSRPLLETDSNAATSLVDTGRLLRFRHGTVVGTEFLVLVETGANLLRKKLGEPTWKTLGHATVEALVGQLV